LYVVTNEVHGYSSSYRMIFATAIIRMCNVDSARNH